MLTAVRDLENDILFSPLHQALTPPRGPNIKGENSPDIRRVGNDITVEGAFLLSPTPKTRMLNATVGRMSIINQKYVDAVNGVVQKNISSESN